MGSDPKEEEATVTHRAYSPSLNTVARYSLEEHAVGDEDRREEEAATNPRRASSPDLDPDNFLILTFSLIYF
jgi:hypothetical protein